MLLFSLDPHCTFAATLATALDETLAPHEDRSFVDGEHKTRSLVDPRGADAYVLCSLKETHGRSTEPRLHLGNEREALVAAPA